MTQPSDTTLWYSRSSVPTPLGIAAQLGWLDAAFTGGPVALRSLQASDDPDRRADHVRHHAPDCLRQGGSVPALWARAAGADTRLIGLTWTDEFQVVLTRPDSGIHSAADLRGRRLGLPQRAEEGVDMARATALRGYLTLLELTGIGYREVELVDVPALPWSDPAATPAFVERPAGHLTRRDYAADIAALLRGDVDAIYVKGVRGVEVARLFAAEVTVAADIGGHPDLRVRSNNATPRPLTVSAALLREQPAAVERLLQQVVAVGPWAEQHPADTVALLSRETGSPAQWVSFAYGVEVHRHLHTGLAEFAVAALDDFKNFLFQWGFLPNNFNLRSWIDAGPLTAAQRAQHRRRA